MALQLLHPSTFLGNACHNKLRSGGATAATQAGIADRLFERHGCWRSEAAKDGYVEDSMPALLSVSKSLKL